MFVRKILVQIKNKLLQLNLLLVLSDEEIERMVKEAEENAEADKKRKEEVELRNEADQLDFHNRKNIKRS